MATPFRPFDNVPTEILLYILGSVDARDHLNFKLVSKAFNSCAIDINTTTLTMAEAVKCHAAIEASFLRRRALVCCCCTRCGRVKDTDQFSDPQAAKTKANRTCIACGIRRLKYSNTCLPSVRGERRIPCYDCRQPMPLYAGWELKLAEAMVLLHLTTGTIYCGDCLEDRLVYVKIEPATPSPRPLLLRFVMTFLYSQALAISQGEISGG